MGDREDQREVDQRRVLAVSTLVSSGQFNLPSTALAALGHGSEFVVRLPVMVKMPQSQPPVPAATEPTRAAGVRILVVDDNEDSARSLSILLKMTGHVTHTVHDGRAAIEAAATIRPDVVLLDIGLPNLNGYDVARKIREQPWGKDMVLVALTGWGQDQDRQKSRDAGFNGHLVKPLDYAALEKLLAGAASGDRV